MILPSKPKSCQISKLFKVSRKQAHRKHFSLTQHLTDLKKLIFPKIYNREQRYLQLIFYIKNVLCIREQQANQSFMHLSIRRK